MIMETCQDKAKIRVRIAKSSDLDDIYELDVQTFAMPWSKEALSYDILENDNAFVIVAEYEGEFAGYADIWTVLDEADLNSIAVRVDFRRKGIGDAIMLAMTEMLSANGVATAIKLYKKYGFNECGVRPGYYLDNGEDALIMKRETGGYA